LATREHSVLTNVSETEVIEFVLKVLTKTPLWVWCLLAVLVALAARELKPYSIHRKRILLMPLAFLALGFFTSGRQGIGLAIWAGTLGLVLLFVVFVWQPSASARYDTQSTRFLFPGSVAPLLWTLTIFLASYVLNVTYAIKPMLRDQLAWQIVPAIAYGTLAGVFLGRSILLFRAHRTQASAHSIGRTSAMSGRSIQ
jgi:hypothetical protein